MNRFINKYLPKKEGLVKAMVFPVVIYGCEIWTVKKANLEKEMATHASILAWKSPWTEEPGGCSPWGYMTEHVCTRVEGDGLVALKW